MWGFTRYLLGLLWGALGTTNILADVSRVTSLADDTLEGVPALASGRWSALVGKLSVDPSSDIVDSLLDEAALGNTGAEEDSVDNKQDPGTLLEEESRSEDAEPKGNLEKRNEGHRSIIVLLDELANHLRGSRSRGL